MHLPLHPAPAAAALACLPLLAPPAPAAGGECNPLSSGPDLLVADLSGMLYHGTVGGVSAYSQGTAACNVGDQPLIWIGETEEHPLIGQNVYRLEDGRFEQIGAGWVKHTMAAVAGSYCCDCQDPGDLSLLGVGCSDPYSADTNGDQDGTNGGLIGGLGPRSEVDAARGTFRWPYATQGMGGDAIYKRCQVRVLDLEPSLHPEASFVTESFMLSAAETAAGNGLDNVSWRTAIIGPPGGDGGYHLLATTFTRRREPALFAWRESDPGVDIHVADVPGDGRFVLASRGTDNGDGTWSYEYALYNQTSHRSAGGFVVPIAEGASAGALGFHDVDYHSGEVYDGTDWAGGRTGRELRWSTTPFGEDPNANALRFGTLYNFRFVADVPPTSGEVELELFRPGVPDRVAIPAQVPAGPCGLGATCPASPNSFGSGALLSATGSASVAANDLELFVSGAVPGQTALFFYGRAGARVPFGDGLLCSLAPHFRVPPALTVAPDGTLLHPLDLTVPPLGGGPGAAEPGDVLHLQLWFRDPAGPGGSGFNLSSGLFAALCP